jgi:Conserved TM helix
MDNVEVLLEPLRLFLPKLALAMVVLIVGWGLARLAQFTLVKAMRAFNFNVLTERAGVDGFLQQGGIQVDTVDIFGLILYWAVILLALIVAFNTMGLDYITDLLTHVVWFIPRLFVALLIVVFGAYFSRFMASAVTGYCRSSGIQDGELLGGLVYYAILTFVLLIALDQMQIGGDIIRMSFLIILAGVVFALALAFGLGGQRWAAELLDRWWPRSGRRPQDRA